MSLLIPWIIIELFTVEMSAYHSFLSLPHRILKLSFYQSIISSLLSTSVLINSLSLSVYIFFIKIDQWNSIITIKSILSIKIKSKLIPHISPKQMRNWNNITFELPGMKLRFYVIMYQNKSYPVFELLLKRYSNYKSQCQQVKIYFLKY